MKEILGTLRPCRVSADEPMPKRGVPTCPSWLGRTAKAKWKKLVPELDRLGLLTIVDGDALAVYCQAWEEFEQSTRTLECFGRFVVNQSGTLVTHPAVTQQRTAWKAIREFSSLYGLDPSSRTKIRAPKVDAADPFEEFLAGKGKGETA